MSEFDTFIVVDWSAGKRAPKKPSADAIWIGVATKDRVEEPVYMRTRREAEAWLIGRLNAERAQGRRVLAGFDFPFAYPRGFAEVLTGQRDPFAVWAWFAERITDDESGSNNRFEIAGQINRSLGGNGPFWGRPAQYDIEGLGPNKAQYDLHGLPESRVCEAQYGGLQTCWKLYTTGSVGSQTLTGLPVLHRLRVQFGTDLAVWPFEGNGAPIVLAEVWPTLMGARVAEAVAGGEIKDAAQVRLLSSALAAQTPEDLAQMMQGGDRDEGAILGAGFETQLQQVHEVKLAPPPLRDDCFALPAGVDWTPVDEAFGMLQERLTPVAHKVQTRVSDAAGRTLAGDITARRANPPDPNTAVDGYGFAHASLDGGEGPFELPLAQGRAAAGVPYHGTVPAGCAIRVLTGASLPEGVDTVVLEEDVRSDGARIAFRGPVKSGANTRKAGEDVDAGDVILRAGRLLTPADAALMSAVGIKHAEVFERLRVGVLSTGDELVEAGGEAADGQIFDANRPMLLAQLDAWGFDRVDLGRAPDDRTKLRAMLDAGAARCDAILTSGGASAGDEDHMSALLAETGSLAMWRIALKPGRPLALGLWQGVPVFGLPGNPVAALVCTLVFARPALNLLAGRGWTKPQGFDVPAAFEKRKKAGRREYLRARIRDGQAEVFKSEGSGRISGLSWAEGLVELPDGASDITHGTPVRYIPFSSF